MNQMEIGRSQKNKPLSGGGLGNFLWRFYVEFLD